MEILTMLDSITHMIIKPLSMVMASPPHGYPRRYPEYQNPYDINPSRSTPQSSYIQEHERSDDDNRNFLVPEKEYQVSTTTIAPGSYRIKGKEMQSQDFGQSHQSGIQNLKGKERKYQDNTLKKQIPMQDYEEIETDEDKILNPEVPTTSPWSSELRYEGLPNSRRTGCRYEVSGLFITRTNLWSLSTRHLKSEHNHEASQDISGLSAYRRFDQKELKMIHNCSSAGAPPEQILYTLKKSIDNFNPPETVAILKGIYNTKTKLLISLNYLYDSKKDSNNTVTHLFFVHSESIRLSKIDHHVRSEKEEDYLWCLKQLNKIWIPLAIPK
ncbi:hypothetical protein BY996DRAFT_8413523 [Phakopsora pachyrhizi]|nr:hypothetical protein BY996DRAFT_8413523 [Phakopsora pachyrhizi]